MPGNALYLGKNDLPKMPRELADEVKINEKHRLMLKAMEEWAGIARTFKDQALTAQGSILEVRDAAARASRGAADTKAKALRELMEACDRSARLFSSLI
jgi:hypothetical protein